jgi:hypothetical protein
LKKENDQKNWRNTTPNFKKSGFEKVTEKTKAKSGYCGIASLFKDRCSKKILFYKIMVRGREE